MLLCCSVAAQAAEPLVTWQDKSLTEEDYRAALHTIPEKYRQEFQSSMARITNVLESLLVHRTLAAQARELGLDKDPVVKQEMALAVERVLSQRRQEEFERTLKRPDFLPAAAERYKLKPEEFRLPEQVHVQHVLIGMKDRSEEEALKRAEEVRQKALAGEDFKALAKEYSDDPSVKTNEGDLEPVGRGKLVKPFEDAAFALEKAGELSVPVKTKFGYHIIRLVEKLPSRLIPFEEVKERLMKEAEAKFVTDSRSIFLSEIKNDKSIKLNQPAIDALLVKP